jgi:hypothetical protein
MASSVDFPASSSYFRSFLSSTCSFPVLTLLRRSFPSPTEYNLLHTYLGNRSTAASSLLSYVLVTTHILLPYIRHGSVVVYRILIANISLFFSKIIFILSHRHWND